MGFTIKEFIKELKKLPQDMEIWTAVEIEPYDGSKARVYDNVREIYLEWFSGEVGQNDPLGCKKVYDGKLTRKQLYKELGAIDEEIKESYEHIAVIYC